MRNYNKHISIHVNNNILEQNEINSNNITLNNNSHNNIINNKIYNITVINKFGNENLSYLTEEKILNILNMGFQSLPELIKETHFNKDHPENHNIYITNIRNKTILIYDGDRWILTKEDITDDIIIKNEDFIITNYEDLKEKLSIQAVNRLNKFITEMNNPDYMTQLKNIIHLILYNYRDITEHTKEKIKQLKLTRLKKKI